MCVLGDGERLPSRSVKAQTQSWRYECTQRRAKKGVIIFFMGGVICPSCGLAWQSGFCGSRFRTRFLELGGRREAVKTRRRDFVTLRERFRRAHGGRLTRGQGEGQGEVSRESCDARPLHRITRSFCASLSLSESTAGRLSLVRATSWLCCVLTHAHSPFSPPPPRSARAAAAGNHHDGRDQGLYARGVQEAQHGVGLLAHHVRQGEH